MSDLIERKTEDSVWTKMGGIAFVGTTGYALFKVSNALPQPYLNIPMKIVGSVMILVSLLSGFGTVYESCKNGQTWGSPLDLTAGFVNPLSNAMKWIVGFFKK